MDEVPATPARSAARWARTSSSAVQMALAASSGWPRGAAAPTPAPRCRRRSRAPTRWAAARPAAAGRPTRCSSAYRVGARVSWREMSATAVRRPTCRPTRWRRSPSWSSPTSTSCRRPASPGTPTSWRPPAGCASATWSGWPRRCCAATPADALVAAAERADWAPPTTLTAVVLPEAAGAPGARRWSTRGTLQAGEDVAGLAAPGSPCCWCPTLGGRSRAALLRGCCAGAAAVAGPARPWLEARASYDRAAAGARRCGPATSLGGHRAAPGRRWCSAPTPTRSPTCARRRWRRWPTSGRPPPRS